MQDPAALQNPFEHAFVVLSELTTRVNSLQSTLNEERAERKNEIAELQGLLAQEKHERITRDQEWSHKLANEGARFSAVQDRLRLELGDVKMALKKEVDDRNEMCETIRLTATAEMNRLQNSIDQLASVENQHFGALTDAIRHEEQMRMADIEANEKHDKEVEEHLRMAIREEMDEFDTFKKSMETLHEGLMTGMNIVAEACKKSKMQAHENDAKFAEVRKSIRPDALGAHMLAMNWGSPGSTAVPQSPSYLSPSLTPVPPSQ